MSAALKYIALIVVFMFLSSGALVAGFLDVYDSVGYGIFWLLLPMTLLFISAVVVNDRLLIPRLLLRGRYGYYCIGVFGVVYLLSVVALCLEYGTRSWLDMPMRISDYSCPWILADVLGNSLLLAMILLGLGLLHLYRGWSVETEEEQVLTCRLASYISTVNKRLNLPEIDDEPMARRGMKRLVESRTELNLATMLDSAEAATDWLAQNETDLIFLDIDMPGINGIEFARSLPPKSMVIFTTAYSEYAIDSYEVEAIDYIMKPIDPARFNKAVDRAIAYKALLDDSEDKADCGDPDFIIVKADRRYVRVRLNDILYVEGLKDYVIIHLNDRRVVTRLTIKSMEEMLPGKQFLRVSKSYIVNRNRIDSFDSNDVFIGETEIGIGISYKESVLNVLLK